MKLVVLSLLILNMFNTIHSLMSLHTIEEIILDTLIYKNIHFVTFFACFSKQDAVKWARNINKYFISLNMFTLDSFDDQNYEITSDKAKLGFVLDLSCKNYHKILHMAGNSNLYESRYKWLIIDTKNQVLKNHTTISETFINVSLRMDSDVTVALFNSTYPTTVQLYDVYKPNLHVTKNIKVTHLGFWTPRNINFTYKLSEYEQRKNMTGTIVQCGIVKTHGDATTTVDEYYRQVTLNNYDTVNKLSYSLFIHIVEIHNFIADITVESKWFGGDLGGIDEGLAKSLYEKQVDVGLSAGLLKPDRIPFIDFVAPAYPFRTCFIFRNPGTTSTVQNQFIKPFEASLWFSIFAFAFLFWSTLKFMWFTEQLLSNANFGENSWIDTWLLTWAVLCQQGATFIPKFTSGRCAVLSLLLMSLLLYNYYTSSIVSSLLGDLSPAFKTIEELSHSNLEVGLEERFLSQKVLAQRNEPSYMKVEEGIAKVKAGGFAYHTEASTGYPIIQSTFEPYEICDLAEINMFKPTVLWIMTQKRSQYKKLFALGYLKMLESGIISRQQSIWITKKPACLSTTHLMQVGMQPLVPAFLMLLFGIGLSGSLLILEIFLQKYKLRLSITQNH